LKNDFSLRGHAQFLVFNKDLVIFWVKSQKFFFLYPEGYVTNTALECLTSVLFQISIVNMYMYNKISVLLNT